MQSDQKLLPAAFYRSARGAEPVRDWLKELADTDRRALGYDIGVVEFGWPIGMPLRRALGAGLWEIRTSLAGNRIARVMFCIADGQLVLLHGFIKKSRKTPAPDLALARFRQKEVGQ